MFTKSNSLVDMWLSLFYTLFLKWTIDLLSADVIASEKLMLSTA